MRTSIHPNSMKVIARRDGLSRSRRQYRFASAVAGERAIQRWADQGYNLFWIEEGANGLSQAFEIVGGQRAYLTKENL
ncbi:hypothetical protein [Streptomyces uncialis]|uniref:hypothetical protein n=1 Tax=Streptomyces uncialis TaxID=1048205 RepID=UPI00116154AE|nr:hypothetical protein [Streptomyces uncialis]